MAAAEQLSTDVLRALAGFHATRGAVVSLFFDVDPSRAFTRAEIESRLDALVASGRREARAVAAELDHAGRAALEDDLRRAADAASRNLVPPGVGCIADTPDGLWRTTVAPAAVADAVRVGGSAYLVPLAVGHGEQALVAVVSRERGEIFSLEQGRLRTRGDLSEEQPRRHRDAESWQQSKLERRVDALAHKHLVRIARELDRQVHSTPGVRVVLAGEEEHTAALAHLLSDQGRAALAGAVRAEAHAGAAELMPLVMPLLERSSRERERELVTRWRSALDTTGLGVQGWPAVLAAASAGGVELLLLAGEMSEMPGECPVCGRGGREHTRCPVDGATFESRSDSLDLAVRLVLSHCGEVRRVAQDSGFDALGGVGATLRFRG